MRCKVNYSTAKVGSSSNGCTLVASVAATYSYVFSFAHVKLTLAARVYFGNPIDPKLAACF